MSPRIIGANLVVSLKSFSREKSAMFFTIAFPIVVLLVFGTIFLNQDNMRFVLYVQDLDQSDGSAHLVQMIERSGRFRITKVDPASNATQYAKDNKLNLILVIPRGYESSLVRRMTFHDPSASVTVTVICDSSSTSIRTKMQALPSLFAMVNQGMSGTQPFIRSTEVSILNKRPRVDKRYRARSDTLPFRAPSTQPTPSAPTIQICSMGFIDAPFPDPASHYIAKGDSFPIDRISLPSDPAGHVGGKEEHGSWRHRTVRRACEWCSCAVLCAVALGPQLWRRWPLC